MLEYLLLYIHNFSASTDSPAYFFHTVTKLKSSDPVVL